MPRQPHFGSAKGRAGDLGRPPLSSGERRALDRPSPPSSKLTLKSGALLLELELRFPKLMLSGVRLLESEWWWWCVSVRVNPLRLEVKG